MLGDGVMLWALHEVDKNRGTQDSAYKTRSHGGCASTILATANAHTEAQLSDASNRWPRGLCELEATGSPPSKEGTFASFKAFVDGLRPQLHTTLGTGFVGSQRSYEHVPGRQQQGRARECSGNRDGTTNSQVEFTCSLVATSRFFNTKMATKASFITSTREVDGNGEEGCERHDLLFFVTQSYHSHSPSRNTSIPEQTTSPRWPLQIAILVGTSENHSN